MKKSRKAALTALLFSVAMNMNGCVYGPPPDDAIEARREEPSSVYEDSTSSPDDITQSDEGQKEQKL